MTPRPLRSGGATCEADVLESAVARVATLVLHAGTMAERLRLLAQDSSDASDRSGRVRRLEDAASRGRLALQRIVTGDMPAAEITAMAGAAGSRASQEPGPADGGVVSPPSPSPRR